MSPKLHAQHGGTNFWGASEISEEDFFAFSPSANLVGVIEEGHESFPPKEAVKIGCLYSLFLYSEVGKGFVFFDKLTGNLRRN